MAVPGPPLALCGPFAPAAGFPGLPQQKVTAPPLPWPSVGVASLASAWSLGAPWACIGMPMGVPFVLRAWVGSTCCLSAGMWFLLLPWGGWRWLLGALLGAWGLCWPVSGAPRPTLPWPFCRVSMAALAVVLWVGSVGFFECSWITCCVFLYPSGREEGRGSERWPLPG